MLTTNGSSSKKVRISITKSTLKGEGTCFLVNTSSVTNIEDSTLVGCEHAVVVRSGEVEISNSTLSATETVPSVFDYKNFAAGTNYQGGYWNQGNILPAAVLVAGDYSKANNNVYSYAGNVTVKMTNVKLNSADADKIPTVLMASSDPNKKISVDYDEASSVGNVTVYGSDWTPTEGNVGVTISSHDNTLYVNGKKATLVNGKTEIEK